MARIRQFRFKSHNYAQLLSAGLFVLMFNFQNCSRAKLQTTENPKATKAKIAKEVALANPIRK